jgi:hypothetical protein
MVTHLFMQNKNIFQIFKWPLVIAFFTTYGLIAALIEEYGVLELSAIFAIAISVLVILYFYVIKR